MQDSKRDIDVKNRLLDYMGEGEDGMIWENNIEACVFSSVQSLSHVWLFATPWTAAYQAPPSMGFSRQEYWSESSINPFQIIWASLVAQLVKNLPAMQETLVWFLGGEDPLEKG